jgi:8-oxo-dGTP pyrophosphatase MutT (NUDIX family)
MNQRTQSSNKLASPEVKHAASRRGSKSASNLGRAVRLQYGALPYRLAKAGTLEVLMVTTRETRRWIIPKGWPIKGLKPPESAAREAFEEAGVRGKVGAKSIGVYLYEKRMEETGVTAPCEVRVFPMLVKRQFETWPEAHQREARWFDAGEALSLIKERGLQELIASFANKKSGRSVRRKKELVEAKASTGASGRARTKCKV